MRVVSQPVKSNKPSWQTLVNKRNQQLSSPPLQKDQPARRVSHEVDPKEVALHEELMPLFKRKSKIEYKPAEDDMAARIYGLQNNREAERRHSEMHLDLGGPDGISGYHFDELIGDHH